MEDVERLLKMHDAETKRQKGRPSRQVEVYKRAAVILSVTAWESFIEDTIRNVASERIEAASSPSEIQGAFNAAAHAWLDSKPPPKPPDIEVWVKEGWKALLLKRLNDDMASLNTPNASNVQKLSNRYFGKDITVEWAWQRTSPSKARARLNELIKLRGGLVHRGPEFFRTTAAKRKHVVGAISLLLRLVQSTEEVLGVCPRIAG